MTDIEMVMYHQLAKGVIDLYESKTINYFCCLSFHRFFFFCWTKYRLKMFASI